MFERFFFMHAHKTQPITITSADRGLPRLPTVNTFHTHSLSVDRRLLTWLPSHGARCVSASPCASSTGSPQSRAWWQCVPHDAHDFAHRRQQQQLAAASYHCRIAERIRCPPAAPAQANVADCCCCCGYGCGCGGCCCSFWTWSERGKWNNDNNNNVNVAVSHSQGERKNCCGAHKTLWEGRRQQQCEGRGGVPKQHFRLHFP